jgi:hypothetical protein
VVLVSQGELQSGDDTPARLEGEEKGNGFLWQLLLVRVQTEIALSCCLDQLAELI